VISTQSTERTVVLGGVSRLPSLALSKPQSKSVGALQVEAPGVRWGVIGKAESLWGVSLRPILIGTHPPGNWNHDARRDVTCVGRPFLCQATFRAEQWERAGTPPGTRSQAGVLKRVPDSLTHRKPQVRRLISGGFPNLQIPERSIGCHLHEQR
jgi:hypothetical protein